MKTDVENVSATGENQDGEKERGTWTGKLDFILSAVGFCVGLGNVWRFPYLAYRNGGGAFLIPYAIMLATCGLPLYFMELSFGQFGSQGPITIWRAMPLFRGIGYAMVIISALVCIYYNVIIAWIIYYFFASMTSELPWSKCGNSWNTPKCFAGKRVPCNETIGLIGNCTWMNSTVKLISPSEEYWENKVLEQSAGFDKTGDMRWILAACLLGAWVLVFFCMIKGIRSTGKVVYFTATFPYVIMTIVLVRNVTLEGAVDGIIYYINPDWERLKEPGPWKDAATQIFYSLGVGFGGLEMMASFNKFKNNIYRDALTVAILNCCTSVYVGFVIFAALGFMAARTGQNIEDVATDGPGLAFVLYPESLSMMPIAPLWAILFFFMLLMIGLDSQFAMLETVICAIVDEFVRLRRHRVAVTGVTCILLFLLGLPMVTQSGIYWLTLIDWYSASFSLMIVGLLEIIALAWIYNFRRFCADIKMMIGFEPNPYWKVCWVVLTPAVILFILIFSAVVYSPVYLGSYKYPYYAEIIGILMVLASAVMIPIWMLIVFCWKAGFRKTLKKTIEPEEEWGPAMPKYRTGIYDRKYMDYQDEGTDIPVFGTVFPNLPGDVSHINPVYVPDSPDFTSIKPTENGKASVTDSLPKYSSKPPSSGKESPEQTSRNGHEAQAEETPDSQAWKLNGSENESPVQSSENGMEAGAEAEAVSDSDSSSSDNSTASNKVDGGTQTS